MTRPQKPSSADVTNPVKVVGRYELLDPIGHGGMAVVYLARQIDLDRQVALKELRMFQSHDDPALTDRFLREARMAGRMSHPNIVTVHEYFEHEGTPYIAMEYLQRGSLRPWVGSLSTAQIAGVLEGLLAALDHAKRFRIVHRDLKPENLLVTDQGQIKVADFGIAKARTMNTGALLTKDGMTVGTPTYMAPEQAMAQDLGPYTDLYSVGIMAYELLAGRVPFYDTDTPVAIILRHVNEQIPPAHTVNPGLDRAWSDWIERLLVKDPSQRTQTAEQAWDELEEVILRLLGSRWRREARLLGSAERPVARPLTPAPFMSTATRTPVPHTPAGVPPPDMPAAAQGGEPPSGEFESFVWGAKPHAADDPPVAPVAPVPVEPAPVPAESRPVPVEPEPVPAESRPVPVEPAPVPADATPQFVTFDRPAPPSPSASEPAPPAAPAPVAPVPAIPAVPAVPVAPAVPPTPGPKPVWATATDAAQFAVEAPTVMPESVPEPPQSPPASPRLSPEVLRRRRIALAGIGAGVATIAAVGAVLATTGGPSNDSGATPQDLALHGDGFTLSVPTSWREQASPGVPGLRGRGIVSAAGPDRTYVVAEHRPGRADPTLLPAGLRAALRGPRPKPETVTVAGTQAYRYGPLHARGVKGGLEVYAVLTSEGVATVACGSSAAAGPAASACEGIAQTLRLTSAEARTVGLSTDYAAILAKTVVTLNSGVTAVNTSVAGAATAAAQAAAMRPATRLYRSAAASLGKTRADLNPVDRGLNARLAAAFRRFASAYAHGARAAARSDAAALRRARQAVTHTRATLVAVTSALRRLGYTAALPATPVVPRSPVHSNTPPPPPASSSSKPPVPAQPSSPRPDTPPPATKPPPPPAGPVQGGSDSAG
jgi:serine/threonine protein kinase